MRKGRLLLPLVMVIAVYSLAVHGQSSGVGIGLNLQDTSGPVINLIYPNNNSGIQHGNITFFYNVSDSSNVDNCSLIINNKVNITNKVITEDTTLYFQLNNSPIGAYNWSINCTDSIGNPERGAEKKLVTCFFNKFDGATTNISSMDIRNITNFVVEALSYGRINFSGNVSLEQCFDFDRFINISSNKIELDSGALTTFNRTATLNLKGLTFSTPRLLLDSQLCPSDVCQKISYSGGILVFNVTHFTAFSAEETPGSGGSDGSGSSGGGSSGGGGGGGGAQNIPISTDFSVDKSVLKVMLRQGQSKTETLKIKNTGTSIFDVKTHLQDIERFKVSPAESEIITTLNPNEEKPIEFVFKALYNEKPDVYTGKVILKSPSSEKEVPALVEVDSAEPLFDVDISILADSKRIFAGQEILVDVNLFNIRGFGRVDVSAEFSIKDLEGNLIASEHETLAVETQAKFTRSLLAPSDLKPGTYVAYVKVIYGDSIGTSSDLFEIKAKTIKLYPVQISDYRFILLSGAVIAILSILIFSGYKMNAKRRAPITKEEGIKQVKEEEKALKLKKELEALESAYKSGFISQESYLNDRKRIEERLNKLK